MSITKYIGGVSGTPTTFEMELSISPTADGGGCFRRADGQFSYNLSTANNNSLYSLLPDIFKATATVYFNGGVIAMHQQSVPFDLR